MEGLSPSFTPFHHFRTIDGIVLTKFDTIDDKVAESGELNIERDCLTGSLRAWWVEREVQKNEGYFRNNNNEMRRIRLIAQGISIGYNYI